MRRELQKPAPSKWKFHTGGMLIGSPTVSNGRIYFGSTDGNLYAVDAESGAQRWKFDAKSRIPSSPAISGGIVYFTAYDGSFYAVDASTGVLKWKFQTGGERRFAGKHLHGVQPVSETMPDPFDCYLSSPVVWQGAVYFGSGDGNVYSLNAASGALNWQFKTGDVVHASPAIADGTLFIGSWDSFFYAIDTSTGKEKWRFKTEKILTYTIRSAFSLRRRWPMASFISDAAIRISTPLTKTLDKRSGRSGVMDHGW